MVTRVYSPPQCVGFDSLPRTLWTSACQNASAVATKFIGALWHDASGIIDGQPLVAVFAQYPDEVTDRHFRSSSPTPSAIRTIVAICTESTLDKRDKFPARLQVMPKTGKIDSVRLLAFALPRLAMKVPKSVIVREYCLATGVRVSRQSLDYFLSKHSPAQKEAPQDGVPAGLNGAPEDAATPKTLPPGLAG